MANKTVQVLGVASSIGGPSETCAQGPLVLQKSRFANEAPFNKTQLALNWHEPLVVNSPNKNDLNVFKKQSFYISQFVQQQVEDKQQFLILGGDHACAVGTWSGVLNSLPTDSTFALIWIDAHMDAHTLETSPSGNLHGMPVSLLLGKAEHQLQACCPSRRNISGSDLYMFGIRSFEADELVLLSKDKVNVFDSERIAQEGGPIKVLQQLIETVARCYDYYAISLDLDAMDPADAPGVETQEPGGMQAVDLISAFKGVEFADNFLGLEIVEFDPGHDEAEKTEKLVFDLVASIYA